jgi:hypothetical protein
MRNNTAAGTAAVRPARGVALVCRHFRLYRFRSRRVRLPSPFYFFSRDAGMLPPFSAIFFKTVSCNQTFILA